MEKTLLYISLMNLVVVAIGVAVGLWQLRTFRIQVKDDHELRRRSAALEYSFSEDPNMRVIREELARKLSLFDRQSGEISLEFIKSLQAEEPSIRAEIQYVLGRLEAMSIAMKHGIISEHVCRDLMRGSVLRYYRQFRQYIDDVRIQSGNQKIYENLEYYAKKWDTPLNEVSLSPMTGEA